MSELIKRDAAHVWHPYTQHETEGKPVGITRAKNASYFAEDGREIIDLISSWWTCLHGHSHPALNKAIADQAEKMAHIMFSGFTHEPAVALAEGLTALLPRDLNKVFFSDNGSTAVEVALKITYQVWKNRGEDGRTLFVAFDGAYHGDTVGAMSVGKGSGFFSLFEGLMFEVASVPYAPTWIGDDGVEAREEAALEALDDLLRLRGSQIAGIILEPMMQGAGGMRICRPQFVDAVCNKVRAVGGIIIFDEVATGFGRTGRLFALEHTHQAPDVICISKGLTAGYMPLSVTVARDALFNEFLGDDFSRALAHGHSFTANPLACAVANRSLQLFDEEDTLARACAIETAHLDAANDLCLVPGVERARVLGTVLAADIVGTKGNYKSEKSVFLRDWYLSNGFNIRPIGPVVYLMPPLCITDEELQRSYDALVAGLKAAECL